MNTKPCAADVIGVGVVRPSPVPIVRAAPPNVANASWPAYRVDAATEAELTAGNTRRLGRGQMLAGGAVKRAVERAGAACEASTAVAVGTASAEEGDEIAFLENVVKVGEKGSKPAVFVNSVKNALASQIALQRAFRGENQTFVHEAISFEAALWQGLRVLDARRAPRAVVCGVDALAPFAEVHGHLLGRFRTEPAALAPLGADHAQATVPGEGAAAFVLAPRGATASPMARVIGVRARGPLDRTAARDARKEIQFVRGALAAMDVDPNAIGMVLLGANGDAELDAIHAAVGRDLRASVGVYKHRTGDFPTASALGMAIAVQCLAERAMPDELQIVDGPRAIPETVLLYHVTHAGHHGAIVVSSV